MFIICIFTRLGLGRRETRVKTEINQITGDDNGLGKEVRTVFRTVIMGKRSSQKKSEMIWSPPPRPAPNSSQGEGTLQSLDFSGHHAVRAGRPRAVLRGIQTSADPGQRAPQEKMAERSHRDLQGLVLESLGTISGFCCELSYLPRAPQFCHLS